PGYVFVEQDVDEGILIDKTEPTKESTLAQEKLEQLRDDIAKASRPIPLTLEQLRQRIPEESETLRKLREKYAHALERVLETERKPIGQEES
ncbi:unnamed protein product, partial [Amoebophrya sp. A120]